MISAGGIISSKESGPLLGILGGLRFSALYSPEQKNAGSDHKTIAEKKNNKRFSD